MNLWLYPKKYSLSLIISFQNHWAFMAFPFCPGSQAEPTFFTQLISKIDLTTAPTTAAEELNGGPCSDPNSPSALECSTRALWTSASPGLGSVLQGLASSDGFRLCELATQPLPRAAVSVSVTREEGWGLLVVATVGGEVSDSFPRESPLSHFSAVLF